jgi:hypothetical protein
MHWATPRSYSPSAEEARSRPERAAGLHRVCVLMHWALMFRLWALFCSRVHTNRQSMSRCSKTEKPQARHVCMTIQKEYPAAAREQEQRCVLRSRQDAKDST